MNIRNVLVENTNYTLKEISDALGISDTAFRTWFSRNYSPEFRKSRKVPNYRASKLGNKNPMTGRFREQHPNFKGIVSDGKGYLLVLKPEWYTGRKGSKHIFQHHYNYCLANGLTEVPLGMHVHHIDCDPHNNDPSNLLLVTPEEHEQIHNELSKNLQNVTKDDDE